MWNIIFKGTHIKQQLVIECGSFKKPSEKIGNIYLEEAVTYVYYPQHIDI